MKRAGLWVAVASVLAAASAGLAPYAMPYSSPYSLPIVERPAAEDAGAFEGLLGLAGKLPPSSKLKVLWTHGMCTHPPTWVDDRMKRLEAAVGGRSQTVGIRPVGNHGATLRTDRITMPSHTIDVMFLSWSPLTSRYKAQLTYDHSALYGGDFPYARAALNGELKRGLINDCMTDVVVYGGPSGKAIREAAEEAVCDAVGGRLDGEACDVTPGASAATLAFVTESLGSKLLFDAILQVWDATEDRQDKAATERLARSLAMTRMMYMVANQLPLLDVAGSVATRPTWSAPPVRPTTGSSAKDLFGLLSHARNVAPGSGPMTVVAFSDPNDLLSYRIVPAHLGDSLKEFRVINVIVSNDKTYFNYVERPDTAHCGYTWNSHVFGMIARGYEAGKSLPWVSGLMGGRCPNLGNGAG